MRTMRWPPNPVNGRVPMVQGAEAAAVQILQVLGDLRQNPFNPSSISMGDVTFKPTGAAKARIETALRRLRTIISINSIEEINDKNGSVTYVVSFTDLESRTQGSVRIDA